MLRKERQKTRDKERVLIGAYRKGYVFPNAALPESGVSFLSLATATHDKAMEAPVEEGGTGVVA